MRVILALVGLVAYVGTAAAETYVWVDDAGITHITDDPSGIPKENRAARSDASVLRGLWKEVVGPPLRGVGKSPNREDRNSRLIRGAAGDIERGETARASAALKSVLRSEPANAEAHWYLAELDRQRGRYDSAATHLHFFLSAAGDDLEPWRGKASVRLEALADERRLADETRDSGPDEFVALANGNFRVSYDSDLGRASPRYADTVMGFLERARRDVGEHLGVFPREPMGVVFYGRAAYLRAHKHRFSFQTVGFFDGRIHVVSAAHPERELRDLLFHEYTHAMFREQTGGDRPFWLNEGLAELSERGELDHDGLTRSERVSLHIRIEEGNWIPLRRLAPSFSGLDNDEARAAYLEATAAAAWIEAHTDLPVRRQLLQDLGRGSRDDEALRRATGLDTDGIDAAVRAAIRGEFPLSSGLR